MIDILDRLLGWIDKPWKAFALATLLPIGGFVLVVTLHHDQIVESLIVHNVCPKTDWRPSR